MINIGINNTPNEEFIIDIRDKNQIIKARIAIGKDDVHVHKLMGDHYIEFEQFSLPTFELFKRSDYIIWEGEKYIIKEDYQPSEENKFEFKYTLRFDHWTTFLQDATFYYLLQDLEEVEWSLTSNAASHIQHLADNANRYFGVNTFNVGTVEFADVKYIQYSKTDVWSAANQIAEAYEGEWYLTGTTFHLVKKVSFGAEIDFESEVSVMKMERSEGDNSERYTRILALGSTRNLPANYRETTPGEAVDAIYQQRLRIPASKGSVIDAYPDMSPEEVTEQPVIFEDIYPKRIGTISEIATKEYTDTNTNTGVITKWNAYKIKDTGINFKKEYLFPGKENELGLHFESGPLNGMDFYLLFHESGFSETDNSQYFEIVRNEDYGKALPNDIMKPTIGSEYVLYGFNIQLVSDLYIPEAEQELYDTAVEWQQDRLNDKSVFECPTVMQYFADHEMDLEIGQKVKLVHSRFENGYRSSRIQGFEKKLINKYDASYTVGDNASSSWPDRVEESIKTLQLAGNTYQQVTSGGTIYLIKQFDQVAPTDFNAYSAKASDAKYLNKQTGGTVQGDTTFQKDVKVQGKTVSNQFGNDTFSSGQFGSGFRTWLADNGQSYAEFDNLLIRREMLVYILTIAEIKSVGGSLLLSLANMTASAVTDGGTYWKVSFDSGDGTIPNQFAVDDQVVCRKFNGANIKYYWAKVTSIGSDYINISKSDKDGSGIPAIGDEIIQFGNRTNTSRQAAILMSTYGVDAPSFKQYAGINSYDLTGKEVTVISPSGNKFTGDFIIKSTGKTVDQTIIDSVSSIQIGGTNLLLSTKLFNSNWDKAAGASLTNDYYKDLRVVKLKGAWQYYYQSYAFESGVTYTLSAYVKAETANTQLYVTATGVTIGYVNQNVGLEWQRYSWTFTAPQTATATIGFLIPGAGEDKIIYVCGYKLEKGNKATDYSEAIQDVQARIEQAQTAATAADAKAQQAQTDAAKADAKAVTANSLLADIASDDKLVPSEKQDTQLEWDAIKSEYTKNVTQATNFSVSYTAYQTAYNSLNSYITPLLASLTVTSNIIGTTFRSTFKSYYDARTDLLNAIATKAKTLADTAQGKADESIQRVSITESSLIVLNDKIEAKVTQNDFNTLEGRVSTSESNQTQTAEKITQTIAKVETKNAAYKSYSPALTDRPSVPYSKGDLWITYDGRILQAANTRLSGAFIESDWKDTTKYTDDTAVNNLQLGGRNYVRNSKEIVKNAYSDQFTSYSLTLSEGLQPNTQYTLSIGSTEITSGTAVTDFSVIVYNYSTSGYGNNLVFPVSTDRKSVSFITPNLPNSGYTLLFYTGLSGQSANRAMKWTEVQLEKANKAGAWALAPEDTQALITAAQTTATNAATAATNAQTSANTANSLLSDIASDNKLDPSEKQSTLKEWNIIQSEYTRNVTQAASFTASSAAYTTAYNSLSSYITPLLSNMNATSDIVGTTFRSTFKAYYDSRTDLLNAIATKARDLANAAQSSANMAQSAADAAQTTANTKNRIYYQDTTPIAPSGGFRVGDLWYRVSLVDYDGNVNSDTTKNKYQLQYRWNGSTWIQVNWSASRSWVVQTDNSITSVVEKTGIDSLGNEETLYSKINQTANEIRLEVNNIQIGGSNLLLRTKDFSSNWGKSAGASLTNDYYKDLRIAKLTGAWQYYYQSYAFEAVATYTLSAYVKAETAGVQLYVTAAGVTSGYVSQNVALEWTRYSWTFTAPQATTATIGFLIPGAGSDKVIYVCGYKLEKGNKATDFSEAIQDVQARIDAAQTAANTAISNFNNIVSDSILDPSEKQTAKREWEAVQAEYSKNYAQAVTYSASTSAYQSAYNALNSYITPLLASMTTNSNIVAATYINKWTAYYNANVDLLNDITTKAKDKAVSEVKAGISVTSDTVTVFGQQMKVDSDLIANAIQTNKLQVGRNLDDSYNTVIHENGTIDAKNANISGTINSKNGAIGGFALGDGRIGTTVDPTGSTSDGLSIYNEFIKFSQGPNIWAGIGTNVFPSSSGMRALARFDNSESNPFSTNTAAYVRARNALTNTAIDIDGGHIAGLAVRTRRVSANTTLTNADVFISCYNTSTITLTLPSNPEIGKVYNFFRVNSGSVNISGNGKPIISRYISYNTLTISTSDFTAMLVYDGANWCGDIHQSY